MEDNKKDEISEGGSRIYRHSEPKIEKEELIPAIDLESLQKMEKHYEQYLGKIENVLHEIHSEIIHVDLHIIPPSKEQKYYTIITSGMSSKPQTCPEEFAESKYVELLIHLPMNWPMQQNAFQDERNYWPLRLLKILTRFPHLYQTWLYWGHTIPNGDPPEPYADNTKLCCALLYPSILAPQEFFSLPIDTNKEIKFFAIYPLYLEEMEYKLKKGTDKLIELFDQHKISPIVNINRKNVCV